MGSRAYARHGNTGWPRPRPANIRRIAIRLGPDRRPEPRRPPPDWRRSTIRDKPRRDPFSARRLPRWPSRRSLPMMTPSVNVLGSASSLPRMTTQIAMPRAHETAAWRNASRNHVVRVWIMIAIPRYGSPTPRTDQSHQPRPRARRAAGGLGHRALCRDSRIPFDAQSGPGASDCHAPVLRLHAIGFQPHPRWVRVPPSVRAPSV